MLYMFPSITFLELIMVAKPLQHSVRGSKWDGTPNTIYVLMSSNAESVGICKFVHHVAAIPSKDLTLKEFDKLKYSVMGGRSVKELT